MANRFEVFKDKPGGRGDEYPEGLSKKKTQGGVRKDLLVLRGKMPQITDPDAGKKTNEQEEEAEVTQLGSLFDFIRGELSGNDKLTVAKRGLLDEIEKSKLETNDKNILAEELFKAKDEKALERVRVVFKDISKGKRRLAGDEFEVK